MGTCIEGKVNSTWPGSPLSTGPLNSKGFVDEIASQGPENPSADSAPGAEATHTQTPLPQVHQEEWMCIKLHMGPCAVGHIQVPIPQETPLRGMFNVAAFTLGVPMDRICLSNGPRGTCGLFVHKNCNSPRHVSVPLCYLKMLFSGPSNKK